MRWCTRAPINSTTVTRSSPSGTDVGDLDDLIGVLGRHQPGDIVSITVDRPDVGEVDTEVELIESANEPGQAARDRCVRHPVVRLPFEIAFDTGEIGGPSAGLAFTLTLLDELTDGDLLGGVDVAVTGTMQLDGTVGPIGRLTQKVGRSARPGSTTSLSCRAARRT